MLKKSGNICLHLIIKHLGLHQQTSELEFECDNCKIKVKVLVPTLPSFNCHMSNYADVIVAEAKRAAQLALEDYDDLRSSNEASQETTP